MNVIARLPMGTPDRPDGFGLRPDLEAWIRERYERVRPDDTFEDLKRRAAFDRQDTGLLRDWIRAAREAVPEMPLPTRTGFSRSGAEVHWTR
ncbi:hypothetical protein [Microvirga massiliensis]|uniref:hypothetical protein n=1 Tax=Microvirga massiliensis TaxID=1033741 RepID=UPI00062B8279|nr:hypothetical protein [Microvirga massiliensis]